MTVCRLPLNICAIFMCLQWSVQDGKAQIVKSDHLPEPQIFGQIPDSLFDLEPDHEFPYEYLLKNVEIHFIDRQGQISVLLEHHYRVKVYSEDPELTAEAALIGIPFYYDQDLEEVTDIEAATHQSDGTVDKLDEEEIQTAELNSRYRIYEFLMPGVTGGSIIEYRYKIHRKYIDELPDFHFSGRVPTRLAHLAIHNENYLRYKTAVSNFDFDVYYHEELIDTSSIPLAFVYERPEPVSVEHWYSCQIPAIGDEAYVSSLNDLRGKLKFQVSEFGLPRQPLENSWEYVAAQIRRSHNNPFALVDDMEEIRELGRELTAEADSPQESRDIVYRYVNQRMTFNGVKRAFPQTSYSDVLEGEPSDQAAINLVLLAMLRGADVEAWPAYLSARYFGRMNQEFPSVYQFNQVMVVTAFDTPGMIMDSSFPNSRPGMIPVDSFNESALVLKQDGFDWIQIRPEYSHFDLDVELAAELSDNGDLSGSLNVLTGGYPAREIREELASRLRTDEVIRQAFFETYSDIVISNADIREKDSGEYPLVVTADFSIPGYATSFREGLQFAPMVVGYLQDNPFEPDSRTAPVTLDAPEIVNVRYEITLPEGYEAGESSQDRSSVMRGAELHENYRSTGRTLEYVFKVTISRKEFAPGEYHDLRRIYERWVFLSNNEWYIEKMENL